MFSKQGCPIWVVLTPREWQIAEKAVKDQLGCTVEEYFQGLAEAMVVSQIDLTRPLIQVKGKERSAELMAVANAAADSGLNMGLDEINQLVRRVRAGREE